MTSAGVEELYKNYGILADAGDSVSQVSFLASLWDIVVASLLVQWRTMAPHDTMHGLSYGEYT